MAIRTGDVIVVRTPGWGALLIRFGAWLHKKPSSIDHVAVVVDDKGTVIEAEPNGVRLGTVASYDGKYLISNPSQPKSDEQRANVAKLAMQYLGDHYDWEAIAEDAAAELGIHHWVFFKTWVKAVVPKSFVCSSLAAYIYALAGLESPTEGRWTTPADWAAFIHDNHYE